MSAYKLREWQQQALDVCLVKAQRKEGDRVLIYACPGSGKTIGGLVTAMRLTQLGMSRHIVVVTPNLGINNQWVGRAKLMGIDLRELNDARDLKQDDFHFGVTGFVMSYQKAVNWKRHLREFCAKFRPIVILDEVHHTAGAGTDREGNAWGFAVEHAFEEAAFKICSTGTPFRQGNDPIAFVNYNDAGEAFADVKYTYKSAITEGVCRPIEFEFYDGVVEFNSKNGRHLALSFESQVSKKLSRERLEAALSTDGNFPLQMITAAHAKLLEIREGSGVDATAGGLVVAMDIKHAEAIADILEEIAGERPVIIHNEIEAPQQKIEEFRNGNHMWIVGIQMLSEGVDIPRLRVGVYATRIRAALYFHQFCGRFTRVQESAKERSFVFLPRDPEIAEIAREIEKEKCHALHEQPRFYLRGPGPGGPRSRSGVVVMESDSEAVEVVVSGVPFSTKEIESYRPVLQELRKNNPTFRGCSDAELLKLYLEILKGSAA